MNIQETGSKFVFFLRLRSNVNTKQLAYTVSVIVINFLLSCIILWVFFLDPMFANVMYFQW